MLITLRLTLIVFLLQTGKCLAGAGKDAVQLAIDPVRATPGQPGPNVQSQLLPSG